MKDNQPKPTLYLIEQKQLVSVCFVLDYIELKFDRMIMAALAPPVLVIEGKILEIEDSGYRDALCFQIGKVVQSTIEAPDVLTITLDDGTRILVRLDDARSPGPEMATLSGGGQFYGSWLKFPNENG